MSVAQSQVFENPEWEKARKALEAVSPKKGQQNNEQSEMKGEFNNSNMTPQELYYQQLNNYQQSFGPRP